jgi:hypothetical protein
MTAQVLQIFLGKEHLAKKSADLYPRQEQFKGTIFQWSTKPFTK